MEDNVKSFLDKIQELNDKKITVQSFSTGKSLKAIPMTFKQQKEIIGTIADGPVGGLKLQKIINDIILENVEGDTDNLDLSDKTPIIMAIRIASIGNKLKTSTDHEIDLDEISKKIPSLKLTKDKKFQYNGMEITLSFPTLKEENKIINAAMESIKKVNDPEVGKNIGNIYTYEICKFISKIEFGENVINFRELPVKDKYKIVENLPVNVNKEVILFIQDFRNSESERLTYEEDGNPKTFDIDVSFFDS